MLVRMTSPSFQISMTRITVGVGWSWCISPKDFLGGVLLTLIHEEVIPTLLLADDRNGRERKHSK